MSNTCNNILGVGPRGIDRHRAISITREEGQDACSLSLSLSLPHGGALSNSPLCPVVRPIVRRPGFINRGTLINRRDGCQPNQDGNETVCSRLGTGRNCGSKLRRRLCVAQPSDISVSSTILPPRSPRFRWLIVARLVTFAIRKPKRGTTTTVVPNGYV